MLKKKINIYESSAFVTLLNYYYPDSYFDSEEGVGVIENFASVLVEL